MNRIFFIFVLMIAATNNSGATAMHPALSRCLGIKDLKENHEKWKDALSKYRKDDRFGKIDRHESGIKAMRKVYNNLNTLNRMSPDYVNQKVFAEAKQFFSDLDANKLTDQIIDDILPVGTDKLSKTLDEGLEKAYNLNTCVQNTPNFGEQKQRVNSNTAQ